MLKQRSPDSRVEKTPILLDESSRKAKRQSGRFPTHKTLVAKKYINKGDKRNMNKGHKEKPTNFVPKVTNIVRGGGMEGLSVFRENFRLGWFWGFWNF